MLKSNTAAWIEHARSYPLKVAEAPYNSPGLNEVVIRSEAVAINPVDWKQQDLGIFIDSYPSIFGCDIAGIVDEVGGGVKTLRKGDRVISNAVCLVKGKQYGAFQTYVKSPANVTCRLPEHVSIEQGVVLPLAFNTAAIGLFARDNLNLPLPSLNVEHNDGIVFIYGGSTSVGSTAIQLVKAAGFEVLATASKRNHDHCRMLGADAVIDYTDPKWLDRAVRELRAKNLVGVYDSVAHGETTTTCSQLLERLGKSSELLISTNPPPDGVKSKTVFGANVTLDDNLANALWDGFLGPALESRSFLPQPRPEVIGQGLDKIQSGMAMQKQGVSAKKIVVLL